MTIVCEEGGNASSHFIFLSIFFAVSEILSIFANGEERIRSSRRSVMHELRMKT
jgi:hypothetical protein